MGAAAHPEGVRVNPEYEKRREYFKLRYQQNRERLLEESRAYQRSHPEVVKRAQRRYHEKHADKIRAKRREKHNPDRARVTHRAWVEKNRQRRLAYMQEWRAQNREVRKAYDARYRETHREQRAETQNARRARQLANGGAHTAAQWFALKAAYGNRCGYCGASARLTKDHATPLARGGGDAIDNIIPACLPCNRRKHAKTVAEFLAVLAA